MEFKNINQIEKATSRGRSETFRLGMAMVFIVGIMLFAGTTLEAVQNSYLLIAAAMIGGLTASMILFVLKKTMVHEKLVIEKEPIKFFKLDLSRPTVRWKEYQPDWIKNESANFEKVAKNYIV